MKIKFTKMHGLGNDFVVLNCINQRIQLTAQQIQHMADRHFGVGFDQLLLLQRASVSGADFDYRIYNADGTESAQCGNGARCLARYIVERGISEKRNLTLATKSRLLEAHIRQDNLVTVNMGQPRFAPQEIPVITEVEAKVYMLELGDMKVEVGLVNMGNPHAVIPVEDITNIPVQELGARIEQHPSFPEKVNVGFMQILDRQHIKLRVFERGAGETLACGSGACAAVVVGSRLGMLGQVVAVDLNGGRLTIDWAGEDNVVLMTGPGVFVFDGEWNLETIM